MYNGQLKFYYWQTKLYKVESQADNNDKGKLQAANKVQQHHSEHCHVEQLKNDEQTQTHEMYVLWRRQQCTQSYMTYNVWTYAYDQLRRATCSMT